VCERKKQAVGVGYVEVQAGILLILYCIVVGVVCLC